MTWQEVIAAALAVATTLGAAVRWLLQWLLGRQEQMQDRYLLAQRESEERWQKLHREMQARLDEERDARLADRTEHTREMRSIIDQFTALLSELRRSASSRPPP